jgi:tetratricopeptide (TPR) repeat protein
MASGVSTKRKWIFRFAAMLLVPALLLVLLELTLRLFGYGYPTTFFLKSQINGKQVFIENQQFGLRFFRGAAVRSPPATVMSVTKPPNTYRIFIFGESAAMGDPEQAYGFWRYLDVLLHERFPGARFEVVCAAMTGINSHAIVPIARECAKHDGDLWIIYMGNNEMTGPFGPSNASDSRVPRFGFIRASLWLKTTRTGQLLESSLQGFGNSKAKSWQGMATFLERQLRHDDPGRKTAREYFRRNLDEILRTAEKAGVKVVISTAASNVKDCAPFASLHSAALSPEHRQLWDLVYREATALEAAGRFSEAIARYRDAAAIDSDYAELQFRLGTCFLATTNHAEALRCFERARDLDALPFRTDSALNEIIKAAALNQSGRGIAFVDAAKTLGQFCEDGILGRELFYEHVHFNFGGNQILARVMAESVRKLLPSSIAASDRDAWASPARCDQQLGLSGWNRYHSYEAMLQRIVVPPFTNQLTYPSQLQMYATELAHLKSMMTPDALGTARQQYHEVLSARPDDYLVRRKFAEFLSAIGDSNAALEEWKRIRDLLPHHPIAYFRVGKQLAEIGKYDDAEKSLRQALRIRSDFADAWLELGNVLAQRRELQRAMDCYAEAKRLQPGSASVYYYLASLFLAQQKRAEAIQNLREAVRLRPTYWEARYLLGLELARAGDDNAALAEFSEVVRLRPDHATAHLNLGVALQKKGRTAEALARFRETLRLDPSNAMAQQFISQLQ